MYDDGAGNVETTVYVGGLYEKNLNASDTDHRHYVYANGQAVALYTRYGSGGDATKHLLYDHQGSVAVIHDGSNPVPYESFTAFGERRDPSDWSGPPSAADKTLIAATTDMGMTGHDNLEGNTLIHMNGRVMDSLTGRFLSADPFIPNPGNTQSFNRYSYVGNNPLSFTDPSGFTGLCPWCRGGGDSPYTFSGIFRVNISTTTRTQNVPPAKPITGCLVGTAEGCYGKPGGGFKFEIRVDIPGLPNPTYGEEDSLILYYVDPASAQQARRRSALYGGDLDSEPGERLSEREVLATMIEHARNGNLGFEVPARWTYTYSDRLIACGSTFSGIGCAFRAEITDPEHPKRVFALTDRENLKTEFYRGVATEGDYDTSFQNPSNPDEIVFTPPSRLDAYEQAAWILGHEINGHINNRTPGTSAGEFQSQYYGRIAVQAWRKFLEESNGDQ